MCIRTVFISMNKKNVYYYYYDTESRASYMEGVWLLIHGQSFLFRQTSRSKESGETKNERPVRRIWS